MTDIYNAVLFKNVESPFTEIFSLLKRNKILPEEMQVVACNTDDLKVLHQHADNAMDVLLQGIQELGNLMSFAADKKRISTDFQNVGYFISAVANLTEALNVLRLDADYVLRQRGEIDY